MKYIVIVFLLIVCMKPVFALKEIEHKTYITYDGKSFNNKEEAISYEKIMGKVDVLMKVFQEEVGSLKKKKLEDEDRHIYLFGYDPYKIEKYNDYRDLFFKCFEEFDEQGYEVEIKISKKGK